MEFHIAHEKTIQERKKYLIPLLLDNVKPAKIKDADLRLYLESHTYLDCKDQVGHWFTYIVMLDVLEFLLFISAVSLSGKYEEKTALCHVQSSPEET